MAKQRATNIVTLFGGYNVTGAISATALNYGAEQLDGTTYGAGATRSHQPGFKTVVAQHEGFWEAGTGKVDPVFFTNVATTDKPMSLLPTGGAEGEIGYTFLASLAQYNPLQGAVGELLRFSVRGEATEGPLVRGTVMQNGTETATDDGTGYELGAVSATQRCYAALHVLAASGTTPSLTVTVESSADDTFASPTTRVTFDAATDVGSQWESVAGAITDTYWRVSWTISGTDPSFQFVVVAGII